MVAKGGGKSGGGRWPKGDPHRRLLNLPNRRPARAQERGTGVCPQVACGQAQEVGQDGDPASL